jgi:hypothetical protein
MRKIIIFICVILVLLLMLFKVQTFKQKPVKFVETMFGFSGGAVTERLESVIHENDAEVPPEGEGESQEANILY